jgi:hypothetical protein
MCEAPPARSAGAVTTRMEASGDASRRTKKLRTGGSAMVQWYRAAMPKLRYVLAVVCYVAIPAVVVAGVALFVLIDPEMARGRSSYARDYRLLDAARLCILWASAALALVLWVSCCYLVLTSRRRSLRWLPLAVAGPFGFSVIAALEDRSPTPSDRYQHVIRNLPMHWRVCLEVAVFIGVWFVAYGAVLAHRELMIYVESLTTGTPVSTLIAAQTASSGMWAAGEGFQELYLVPLLYLVWPTLFNIAGWLGARWPASRSRSAATSRSS